MAEKENKTPEKEKIQRPRGTTDIFGEKMRYFKKVSRICKEMARFYGFDQIEVPVFERKELFTRGIGEGTDIVDKEMYTLYQGKNPLALRPESTAGMVRAYIQNGMNSWPKPVMLWHLGPIFRHERPQAGRYRQFWQFGAEVFGQKEPVIDAHVIQMFYSILKEIGFSDLRIKINSLGCPRCRGRYEEELEEYLKSHKEELCADCKRRLEKNVLRVLDCKTKKCQKIINNSPQILDTLWKKCRVHFKEVLEFLDALDLPYELDPFLVRGLDYYTRTVFEIVPTGEENSLAGGGRYDKLVSLLGGRETPACGAALGIERVVEEMKKEKIEPLPEEKPKVFLAQLGASAKREALKFLEELRKEGIWVAKDFACDSLSDQLSVANELGAEYTIILAKKELVEDKALIRDMKEESQEKVDLDKVLEEIKKKIK